jgi:hypothetical protein
MARKEELKNLRMHEQKLKEEKKQQKIVKFKLNHQNSPKSNK